MKISEAPQDDVKTMQGKKKALYAVDDQGRYAKITTTGWESEEIVLKQVIGEFEEKARGAATRVESNTTSPIEYFMYKNWMDPRTLAQAMGLCRWQVKRHLKPGAFKKLGRARLAEYARVFRVSVDTLKNFAGEA